MKQSKQSWFDSKWFSVSYLLLSVVLWISILIIQILHKTDQANKSLSSAVECLIPTFCLIATIYSLITNRWKTNYLVSLALFFCFMAELLGSLGVSGSIGIFVGCHLCLSYYFLKIKFFSKKDLWKLIPILVFYIVFVLFCFLWLIPRHTNADFIFKLAVPIYGALLCFMLWRAICTYGKSQWLLYSVAALLFALSDFNVLLEGIYGFGSTDPLGLFIFTWITYPLAISLVSMFNRNTLHFADLNFVV